MVPYISDLRINPASESGMACCLFCISSSKQTGANRSFFRQLAHLGNGGVRLHLQLEGIQAVRFGGHGLLPVKAPLLLLHPGLHRKGDLQHPMHILTHTP